jgi:hypothetical protein
MQTKHSTTEGRHDGIGIPSATRPFAVANKNKQNEKTEPMKIIKNLTFAGLAALAVTLLFQIPTTRSVAADGPSHGTGHTLHLIPHFNPPVTTDGFAPPLPVGAQLTFGGTLAHPDSPDEQIGTIGLHFVVTLTGLSGDEVVGNGCMILPDGKISFQILLRRPAPADSDGNINRYSAITGGTGAYWNARGEANDVTHANGYRELVLNFSH